MKKMNIALFTAAAMFATSAAVAVEVDGPHLSGRIQTIYVDTDEAADEQLNNMGGSGVFLAASGSATDLVGGFSMSYYLRALQEAGSTQNNFPYSFVNFEHDAFTVNVGTNDDLVYRFVEVFNDSNAMRDYDGVEGPLFNNEEQVSFLTDLGGSPVTIGVYANDSSASDAQGSGTGIDTTQIGASVDLGAATLAAVYSESDRETARYDESTYIGGTYDFGLGTVGARVADLDSGENPFALSVAVPVTANTTIRGYHGNDDNSGTATDSQSSTGVEARTVLGAGLDVFAGLTRGENSDGTSADNVYVGTRLGF